MTDQQLTLDGTSVALGRQAPRQDAVRGRGRPRKFDRDEAARRVAAGDVLSDIATELGVTQASVLRVLTIELRASVVRAPRPPRPRKPIVHGSRNAYWNLGCRCEECREAAKAHRLAKGYTKGREPVQKPTRICQACGVTFARKNQSTPQWNRAQHCSSDCRFHVRAVARVIAGETRLHSSGYIQVYLPWHPTGTKSYVYEHRLVMERKLGRLLGTGELVHHKNEVKTDNRSENLEVLSSVEHKDRHAATPQAEIVAKLRRGISGVQIMREHKISSHRLTRITKGVREGTIR